MGDLDVYLIKEFSLRPAFYNKAHPNFKDKIFTERAWEEIASKLGYDVSMLRDRMNQLRNRYNLEKRKVDTQKADGIENARSTWPLFDYLTFLDGHIRPRKSYKRMRSNGRNHPLLQQTDDYIMIGDNSRHAQYADPAAIQQMVQIKYEQDLSNHADSDNATGVYNSGYETEEDTRRYKKVRRNGHRESTREQYINPASFLVDDNDSSSEQQSNDNDVEKDTSMQLNNQESSSQSIPNNSALNINVRNIDSLKTSNDHHHQQNSQSPTNSCLRNNSTTNSVASPAIMVTATNSGADNSGTAIPVDSESQSSIQNNSYMRRVQYKKSRHTYSDKYEAFGNFIATSLTDLSEEKALKLVEKFTGDIVKALLSQVNEN